MVASKFIGSKPPQLTYAPCVVLHCLHWQSPPSQRDGGNFKPITSQYFPHPGTVCPPVNLSRVIMRLCNSPTRPRGETRACLRVRAAKDVYPEHRSGQAQLRVLGKGTLTKRGEVSLSEGVSFRAAPLSVKMITSC